MVVITIRSSLRLVNIVRFTFLDRHLTTLPDRIYRLSVGKYRNCKHYRTQRIAIAIEWLLFDGIPVLNGTV